MTVTTITLVIYLAIVFVIGLYNGRGKSQNEEDYYLGERQFGPLPTAISMGATDSSGWIFIGACGYAYSAGAIGIWMLPGFAIGALINWLFLGPRLRHQGKKLGALDLVDFFEKKLHANSNDKSHTVKIIGAILIVLFFIPYMAAQLTAAGKTINVLVDVDYNIGLIGSAVFVIAYCFSGGYKSVIYTDLMQGSLMLVVFFVFPPVLIFKLGGWNAFWAEVIAIDPILATPASGATGATAFGIILGLITYGVGEIGQPHILQRFFSAKDDTTLKYGTVISTAWMIGVMGGSSLLGLLARVYLPNLADSEYAFPSLVAHLMPAVIVGIVVGAIFAAIQSTFSSQLLVAVQSISSNLLKSFSNKERSQEELVKIGKITMIIMGIVATALALLNIDTVFLLVIYAWSGLASAFGPLLYMLLYFPEKVTKWGAIMGMITGTVVSTLWYLTGLSKYIMELVPGMIVSLIVIILISKLTCKQKYYNKSEE